LGEFEIDFQKSNMRYANSLAFILLCSKLDMATAQTNEMVVRYGSRKGYEGSGQNKIE